MSIKEKIKIIIELEATNQNIEFVISNMKKNITISNSDVNGLIVSAWQDDKPIKQEFFTKFINFFGRKNVRRRNNSVI